MRAVLWFNMAVGYSRHKDPESKGCTHAWVAFGEGCTAEWHRELSANLLLDIVGNKSCFPYVPPNATPSRWRASDESRPRACNSVPT